ncbi:MAG: hypothetical protein EA402_11715 [Planctomycetota bacterium]|nr:MAG: hypothetical protein EA402_11715 [Planctomycetota bacterium]
MMAKESPMLRCLLLPLCALLLVLPLLWPLGVSSLGAAEEGPLALREAAQEQFNRENWGDAYGFYRQLALHPDRDADIHDLQRLWGTLERWQAWDQVDDLVDALSQRYGPGHWVQRLALAEVLIPNTGTGSTRLPTWAREVDGQWRRGHRGEGLVGDLSEHDRWRGLRLIESLLPSLSDAVGKPQWGQEAGRSLLRIAQIWQMHPQGNWALQLLTDLNIEPDPAHPQRHSGFSAHAPVHADGSPRFFSSPASWAEAASDVERVLWLWQQARQLGDESLQRQADRAQADLALRWYGITTLGHRPPLMLVAADGEIQEVDVRHLVQDLGDDETIARLASGVRRFQLPSEWNYLALWQRWDLHQELAQEFEHRRQYPRAAAAWAQAGNLDRQQRIIADALHLGSAPNVALGDALRLPLVYRNAQQVTLTAQRIDLAALLAELRQWRAQVQSQGHWWPGQVLSGLGRRLMADEGDKWVSETRESSIDLQPAADHLPSHTELSLEVDAAGAWLITVRTGDGAVSRSLAWVVDTVLLTQNAFLESQVPGHLHMVVDARDGRPLAGVEIGGQGVSLIQDRDGSRNLILADYAARSDDQGLAWQRREQINGHLQWLLWARDGQRLALHDPHHLSYSHRNRDGLHGMRSAVITDRPIYRPGDRVQGKVWQGTVDYLNDGGPVAPSNLLLHIQNPEGEHMERQILRLDQWGGATWEWTIPEDARLGVYVISVGNSRLRIRVEEYRSPEFRVQVDLPLNPIALGELAHATVTAQYVWGAPLREAEVQYRIERQHHRNLWFPEHPWDWLYGNGFWWRGVARPWFDDWQLWHRQAPDFGQQRHGWARAEAVASGVLILDEEGRATIPIDSAQARAAFGDSDHRYTIHVEVTDSSRRTEVGNGQLIAAREPFTVTAWTWQGFQRVGEHGRWQIRARSADGRPLAAAGSAELRQLAFDESGVMTETVVATWEVACDEHGAAELPVHWREPGQYRLWVALRHDEVEVTSSQIVAIVGAADDALPAGSFRSAPLELHLAQATVSPGDEAEILITSSRADAQIMLFERVSGHAVHSAPRRLQLLDGAAVHRLAIKPEDYPNIFVEAIAVIDGQVYRQHLLIPVPPAERLLQVDISAAQGRLQPGEKTQLTVTIRNEDGQPLRGSAVIAITDSALDLLAGDLRPPALRQAFWSQYRRYQPSLRHSLPHGHSGLLRAGEKPYASLGIFGHWSPGLSHAWRWALGHHGVVDTPVVTSLDVVVEEISTEDAEPMAKGREAVVSRSETGGSGAFMAIGAGGEAGRQSYRAHMQTAASLPGQALPEPALRQHFADTALWVGALTLDESGRATVDVTLPDNVTTWSARSWAVAAGWRVGEAKTDIVAAKDVLVRLHAPRFATEGDVFQLSATVHNELDEAISARVDLSLELAEGAQAALRLPSDTIQEVAVPARGEVRVSWDLRATAAGPASLRVRVRSPQGGDAVGALLPIHIYGAQTTQSQALVLSPEQGAGSIGLTVPEERIPEASELILRWSPSAAAAVVEAIPYLADYPYGCTEQTLNRFVPSVVALQLLESSGIDLAALRQARASVNPGQLASPDQRWDRERKNPVFDPHQVRSMVREGVERLGRMQLNDGGWGWFSGNHERSSPHTTVVVVRGLMIAQTAGAEVDHAQISRGLAWLTRHRASRIAAIENSIARVAKGERSMRERSSNIDAYIESVLADADQADARMRGWLLEDRSALSTYGKALLGLACLASNDGDGLQLILENLGQFVESRDDNHTAWLRVESPWWRWYGSEYEANSAYLLLLVRSQADPDLSARLARYLVASRRGQRWNSTRDTAWAVEALSAYLAASDELKPQQTVRIFHGDKLLIEERISAENLFTRAGSLRIPAARLGSGEHLLRIERDGPGYLHANAWLRIFSREAIIPAQGLEVTVQRRWWRITESEAGDTRIGADGRPVASQHRREQRQELAADAIIRPGELIEVELIVDSANDYEYILIEDRRFAGAEPVDRLSGYRNGAYMEFRADRVALFVTTLARGTHTYRYRLRAELPGTLNAMPATIEGMYAPELIGNSASRQAQVSE